MISFKSKKNNTTTNNNKIRRMAGRTVSDPQHHTHDAAGVNWMKLRKKLYRTPWVPKLKGPLDDSNIDDYDEDDKVVKFKGDQSEFAGF